jgi:hypothetical protein
MLQLHNRKKTIFIEASIVVGHSIDPIHISVDLALKMEIYECMNN